jgi:uncharacterized membrane protein
MFDMFHPSWWALIIVGVVALARWLLDSQRQRDASEDREPAILRERFARDAVDKAALEGLMRDLA